MVDWEGLKLLYITRHSWGCMDTWLHEINARFPAILAQHERDQRVIEAAEKLRNTLANLDCQRQYLITKQIGDALAEYDKAKQS